MAKIKKIEILLNLCKTCGQPEEKMIMQIVDASCRDCHSQMRLALILLAGLYFGPEKFTAQQIKEAQSKGVIIKKQDSKTSKSTYFANTCNNCNSFVGEFFIHEYLDVDNAENIDLGYYCTTCDPEKHFDLNQS
ncbi:MAG: hypothetical protein WCX97_04925 [Candidatus Magasanikbacteria bacterium]